MEIDYRKLLSKYMAHFGIMEGTCYVQDYHRHGSEPDVVFTDEEWAELQKIFDEPIPK